MAFAEAKQGPLNGMALGLRGDGGSISRLRMELEGGLFTNHLMPQYSALSRRGNVFIVTNQAAQATTAALAVAYTGLCLTNPIESKKSLHMMAVSWVHTVAPAAIASVHIITGYSATVAVVHTVALTIQNGIIGLQNASSALADSSATVPNFKYTYPIISGFTAAALPNYPMPWVDLKGLLVVPPGGYVAIGTLTVCTGFGGFIWTEIQD